MADLSEDATRKVAELARLSLSETEVKEFTAQLGKILGHVEKLSEVNVEGSARTRSPPSARNPMASRAFSRPRPKFFTTVLRYLRSCRI
jgi:aspartyl/glutamyl-tRNA(Asn/Gln) amidotransferase C subunit